MSENEDKTLDTLPDHPATELVTGTVEDTVPLPPDSGKSLATLIASYIAAALLSYFVSKGYFTEVDSKQFMPLLQGVIVLAEAFITTRFLKSRSDVKVEALRAHASIQTARAMQRPVLTSGALTGLGEVSSESAPRSLKKRSR